MTKIPDTQNLISMQLAARTAQANTRTIDAVDDAIKSLIPAQGAEQPNRIQQILLEHGAAPNEASDIRYTLDIKV